ncbi:MAG: carboxypeptidase regulatory-like domain-containing protein, partial [Planctomycetes bacterium]|nr:carboxypeptidase regulatory-like domain-containing protein [Planctomycetota bacterium]
MPNLRLRLCAALACALFALVVALWLSFGESFAPRATEIAQAPLAMQPESERAAIVPQELERGASTARSSSAAPPPEESTTLELRAVHADGTPASDIALAVRTAPRGGQILHVTTDARGVSKVPNAREAILSAAAGALLEVATLGILPEPTPVLLDPRRCFEEPTIVELPPLAELELRVVRANGAPLDYGSAEVMTQAEHGGKAPRGFGVQSFPWWREVEGGGARFTRIQAEVPLFIAVQDAAWKLELLHPHPGLARGERTTLELRFDRLRGLTRARVLDGRTNTPLARSHLQVSWITVEPKSSMSSGFAVTTDEHGVCYFGRAARAQAIELWIEIGEPKLGNVRSAVPLGLGDALHDLGDLVIQPFRPRVAGRVVDEQGAPVPRAEVEARVFVEAPEDTARIRFEHFAARLYADEAGRFVWNAPPVSSDPGVEARAKISLTAYDATRRAREELVSIGALDVELRLQRLGSFQGRLELDPRVPYHVLALEHRLAGDESPSAWTQFYA